MLHPKASQQQELSVFLNINVFIFVNQKTTFINYFETFEGNDLKVNNKMITCFFCCRINVDDDEIIWIVLR